MKSLQEIAKYNSDMNFKTKTLNKVVRTIEKHFGRMRPFVFNLQTFKAFKNEILSEIENFPHFKEINFLIHEEKLLYKISNEIFSKQDEEKIKINKIKAKPTKFERNDKKREEFLKLEKIKHYKNLHAKLLKAKNLKNYKQRPKKFKQIETPPEADSEAETLVYNSSDLESDNDFSNSNTRNILFNVKEIKSTKISRSFNRPKFRNLIDVPISKIYM